jgi:asparagine synthase (glutamine-hydrolysing)
MCGLAGFFDPSARMSKERSGEIIAAMNHRIAHRGPDETGMWIDARAGIALGHQRLSILDLSPAGSQPMKSHSGRFTIAFNGEIYNFQALKEELESADFRFAGHSDTEVILAGIEHWGIENCLKKLTGMFAFAVWDSLEHQLTLTRDRIGEKPLYIANVNGTILFASELKAFLAFPAFPLEIDPQALSHYFRLKYIPAPISIFKAVQKLEPGTFRILGANGTDRTVVYWSMAEAQAEAAAHQFQGSDQEAVDRLDSLLRLVVKRQMISDVPIGAFLSGGLDSSTVVAMMRETSTSVKTFTIGFNAEGFNEAEFAADIAKHLGTEHTELYISEQEALDSVPLMAKVYDEPFSDPSQVPTFCLARMTRSKVTVSLSGDGGDEFFYGYNRYQFGERMLNRLRLIPGPLRSFGSKFLVAKNHESISRSATGYFFSRANNVKLEKLGSVLGFQNDVDMHWFLSTDFGGEALLNSDLRTLMPERCSYRISDLHSQMMYLDAVSYLPDDLMVKVDRACMAVSLESRAPFLDHQLIEFAWSLPHRFKFRNGSPKWLIREVLEKYVPKSLTERPKQGFSVPIAAWLRGPLQDWGRSIIEDSRDPMIDSSLLKTMWDEHQCGAFNWEDPLWSFLMFQTWSQELRLSS